MNKKVKKISTLAVMLFLFIILLGACMVGCTRTNKTEEECHYVPLSKYIDIEQMERFCKSDSLHNKVLVFSNPYCGGCRYEFKERILPAMNEMDTSLWRFFFLIVVVDSTDTLKYNRLMLECQNMGIDTNNAYIWRLGRAKEDYNEVFLRFNSIHPLRNSIQGIPWVILLDKKNFISTQKLFYEDKRDSVWYEPRKFDSYSVHLDDFSIDDTSWFIMVSSNNKK